MKIDACVVLSDAKAESCGVDRVKVPVDMDYVESSPFSVKEWVSFELEKMLGGTFTHDDFEIANMEDIVEDLAFDEFKDAVE